MHLNRFLVRPSRGGFRPLVDRLRGTARGAAVASIVGFGVTSAPGSIQDDAAALPTAAAMASLERMTGEWTFEGKAGDVPYVASQTVTWNEARTALEVNWTLVDEAGRELAGGRGRISWDDIAGAVVNTFAGRDGDRGFTGSATLIAADGAVTDWRGHETRGTSESVNFEVTYDLRETGRLVVDFIPTCIDGSGVTDPVRFAWTRLDPFAKALPNVDELSGEWILQSGGTENVPDGCTMSVARAAGGLSLGLIMREPGEGGRVLGTEFIWLDEASGSLRDRFMSSDGTMMTGTPRLGTRGLDEKTPVIMVRWGEDASEGTTDMQVTSWMWVEKDLLHVAFTDLVVDGVAADAPPAMIWGRR